MGGKDTQLRMHLGFNEISATDLCFEFREGSIRSLEFRKVSICASVLSRWNWGKNTIPSSKRHQELVYNTFWLYFHGSWSDMRSLFPRLAACRESLCSTKGSTEAMAWNPSKLSDPWNQRCCSTKQGEFLRWITLPPLHALLLYESHATARPYCGIYPSFFPCPPPTSAGAPTLPCFIVTVERITLTFSILLCILCLLLSSFTSAIKLYDSRQELFTSVWRQFDKAWINIDLAKYPTEILRNCFTGFQIDPFFQNWMFSMG